MRFLSLFSGIEAASTAWMPLGWECVAVAEVEPFPCAVLKHHYPDVPNFGDVTKITQQQIEDLGHIDLIAYGFPCQDLSVAGNRKGLQNADGTNTRSGLFYVANRIAGWSKARWSLAENVPGLFSSNEGRDFASVVGELSGSEFDVPADGWPNSGVALGERGLVEWVTLDAQFFGVPQRRRRIFIVRDTGDWSSREPLFLIPHSLQGHHPPRSEAGQGTAATVSASPPSRRNGGSDPTAGHFVASLLCAGTGQAGTEILRDCSPTLNCNHEQPYIAHSTGDGYWQEGAGTLRARAQESHEHLVAHSLRGEGFDASEDGTGRGTPLVPVAFRAAGQDGFTASTISPPIAATDGGGAGVPTICFDTTQITSKANRCNPQAGDPCHPLAAGAHAPAIAFSSKDHGADAGDISPTLRSMGHDGSHANGGGQVAVAFNVHGQNSCAMKGSGPSLAALETRVSRCVDTAGFTEQQGGTVVMGPKTAVRRLTPRECERLQGFPDDWTKIPWKGWRNMDASETPEECRALGLEVRQTKKGKWRVKDVDGNRYKALGNSWAVPVARWVGERIAMVEAMTQAG